MFNKITAFIIIARFVLHCNNAWAQPAAGTNFWMGFMENINVYNDSLWIYISSDRPASGTVSIPQVSYSQPFSVSANSFTKVYIPNNLGMNTGSEVIQNKGIHIISNDSVLVTCFNRMEDNTDASGILNVASLDTEYVIMSYKSWLTEPNSRSELLIVAPDSNTLVQITVTDTTANGILPGTSISITLQKGQTYQVQSLRDLTGSKITSNKPIAVFSGNTYTFVPINYNLMTFSGAADHLYEQMLPVNKWSAYYLTTPLKDRNADTFRFLAKEDSTVVSENGNALYTLNAGEFAEDSIGNQKIISSNKSFAVFQFSNGQNYDNTVGDPFMIQIQPAASIINKTVFKTYSAVNYLYYVNIITKNNSTNALYLNGINISPGMFTQISNSGYSYASLSIPDTVYVLQSDSGFIAYQYALSYNLESYGYALPGYSSNFTTAINEINHRDFPIKIYPNPFSREAVIMLPFAPVNNSGFTFKVFDTAGREIGNITGIKSASFIFSRNNLPEGIYFYRLLNEDCVVASGKIIISN